MSERKQLEQAIASLESQRADLGDAVVDAALAPLREKLDSLEEVEGQQRSTAARERRIVTVLFCDVTGSTALAERMDPEEWADIMDRAFKQLIEPVERYGGTVARLMGDAILAFFGAPEAHEDDPQRAVASGLAILEQVAPYRERLKEELGLDFNVRAGINTGLVVVGEVGTELHGEYTAMGDAVNLAARMEQTARPGTLQISENTYRLVAPFFECQPLGDISVKGKSEPVLAYQVLGRQGEGRRVRGLTTYGVGSPLVGREAEFVQAQSAIGRLLAGQGGILSVIGEAGIGKSRLMAELHKDTLGENLTWLEGHTLSYGQTISYWPYQEIFRSYARITEEDSEDQAWQKLSEQITRLFLDEAEEILPYLSSVLAITVRDEYAERIRFLDGEALKSQVYRSSRRFFQRLAEKQPLILVFEDLHWIDQSSADLLKHLLPLVERVPLLLCGIGRPEPGSSVTHLLDQLGAEYAQRYTEIALGPLSKTDSDQLVYQLLQIDDLPVQIREMVIDNSDGNPFYIEELLRNLIETGALIQEPVSEGWRVTSIVEQVNVPDTIQGLIMARIDRLDDELKQVIRRAAVIGRSFLYRVLSAVLESDRDLMRKIERLQVAELIRKRQRLPELEYIFKHALAHEATYESILKGERRVLHTRVGSAIEMLFAERIEEFFGLLAYHYTAAEQWDQANKYLLKAGDQAGRMAADTEALTYYRKAMSVYTRSHGDHWDPLERAMLERKIGEALFRLGEHQQARDYLERSLALLGEGMPASHWGTRLAILGALLKQIGNRVLPRLFVLTMIGPTNPAIEESFLTIRAIGWIEILVDLERFLLLALRGLNTSERGGFAYGSAFFSSSMGMVADSAGRFGLAESYYRRSTDYARQIHPYRPVYLLELGLAIHFSQLGYLDKSMEYARRGAEIARSTGELREWGSIMVWVATGQFHQGHLYEAASTGHKMIELAEEGSDRQVLCWGLMTYGISQRRLGLLEEANASLLRAIEVAKGVPDHVTQLLAGGWLGRCYLLQGELEQAISVLEVSREIYSVHGAAFGFFVFVGAGLAEAYLMAAEGSSGEARREWMKKASGACKQTLKIARINHPGKPDAMMLKGRYEWIAGRRRVAEKWWARALSAARYSGQRYDQGMIHLEIGSRTKNRTHLEKAEIIFEKTGAVLDLAVVQEALKTLLVD